MFGPDFGGETPKPGNPAGFIAHHVSIGTSARGALAEWRDIGGTSGDRKWFQLFGQVTDSIMRSEQNALLDPGAMPSAADYGTWTMGKGGQYATQVSVTFVDADTGLRTSAPYTYVSDVAHTPEEAEAAAMADYGADDALERYGQEITGAFTTNVWATEAFNG